MKNIRVLHRYMGLFFSPAIVFFAFSGALLTLDLQSANRSTGYVPPAWVVEMAQIHKKQTAKLPKVKNKSVQLESEATDPAPPKTSAHSGRSALPLKFFVLVMSVGLIATTLLGIYMAFHYGGDRRVMWITLAGGTLLPIVLIVL